MKGGSDIMSKILGYVLVGLGSAVVAGTGTWYVTQRVVKKKVKEKYEADLAYQLNCCREYYKRKIHENDEELEDIPDDDEVEEYDSVEEAEVDNDIDGLVVRKEGEKRRASEIAQENEVKNYHKMYGEPTVETLFDDDDDDYTPEIVTPSGPYCIRKSVFYKEDEGFDMIEDYDQVEVLLFTEDFVRKDDGEKEYLEILYCNGYLNERRDEDGNLIPIKSDDPWRERVIKSSEAAAIFGQEWRTSFGDYRFNYDENEVCVRNDKLKTDFIIIREHNMYKVAIEGLEPGDPFDYDKVR